MADAYVLSQSDVERLREVVRQVLGERMSNPVVSRRQDRSAAPEVYVARTPTGGIAALQSDVGTGTGDPSLDQPGSAECEIYQIVPAEASGDSPSMMPVDGLTQTVYNLSGSDVAGNAWVLVFREKFGSWVAAPVSTGGGGIDRVVDVVHVVDGALSGTGTGAGTWYCERVAMVGGAWPPVADPSVVYTNVRESENREPRIVDGFGVVTHAIPLYQDIDGQYYVQFWKTDTSDEWTDVVSWTITENTTTCEITATPTYRTLRLSLTVTPPGDPTTGLTVTVEEV